MNKPKPRSRAEERSDVTIALFRWLRSQDISPENAGGVLSDAAAVWIVEGAWSTGDIHTLVDGLTCFNHDVMLAALQLFTNRSEKENKDD